MAKIKRLSILSFLISLLIISSVYACSIQGVLAAELTQQQQLTSIKSAEESDQQTKAYSAISNVVGLKTEHYTTAKSIVRESKYLDQPQKETDMSFISSNGSFRVSCSYVKDTLQLIYFSDIEGELSLKQLTANTVDSARGLLERYKNYTSDSLYGNLASMLTDIKINNNVTKIGQNVKLEVSVCETNKVTYMWTYIDENGIIAERKNVCLTYEQGILKSFSNNWSLYTIGNSETELSANEATKLAIEASKTYSYTVTNENGTEITISNFTIAPESLGHSKLIYVNNEKQAFARGNDPYELYLAWDVPLGFNKFYPGDVSGLTVILWADTGEICGMSRVIVDSGFFSTSNEEKIALDTDQPLSPPIQSISTTNQTVSVLVVGGVICFSFGSYKGVEAASNKRKLQLGAILLCTLIISSVLFFALPQASAIAPTRRSEVYGIGGPGGYNGYNNPGADNAEGAATHDICNYTANVSIEAGYATANNFGQGTTRSNVGSDIQNDEVVFDKTIVFHAGHLGNSAEEDGYEDINGVTILPSYISSQHNPGSSGEHFFVFLWVCEQAPDFGIPAGSGSMATAWTQRNNMNDGYELDAADHSGICYISFYGFSPMLSNYPMDMGESTFYPYGTYGDIGPCTEFIEKFYNYTLLQDRSIHDALDMASLSYFSCNFDDSVLYTGYNSWWPGGDWTGDQSWLATPGYYPDDFRETDPTGNTAERGLNRMRVLGDSTLHLYNPLINFSARDNNNNNLNDKVTFVLATQPSGWEYQYSGSARVTPKNYVVSVNSIPNYNFLYFSYNGQSYANNTSIPLTSDGNLVARYAWAPVYYNLTVSKTGSGTISPSGTSPHLSHSTIPVTATPYAGYMHYWDNGRGDLDWNQTKYILMDSDKTVIARFVNKTAYNFVSHVESYSGAVSAASDLAGAWNDGECAAVAAATPYGVTGSINAHLYFNTTGHIYAYGTGVGTIDVYTSIDGSNWNLVGASSSFHDTAAWVDCGYRLTSFNYIRLVADDFFNQAIIDSVRIDTTYYTLTVSASGGGTTNPSGAHQYLNDTTVAVTATPSNPSWVFMHWETPAGTVISTNPTINIYMDHSQTIVADFDPAPPAHISSIYSYFGAASNPSGLTGVGPDGQYATLNAFGPYNVYGWIAGQLNVTCTAGHIYAYVSGTGSFYVAASNDGSNWYSVSSPSINQGSYSLVDCGTYANPFRYVKLGTVSVGYAQINVEYVLVQQ